MRNPAYANLITGSITRLHKEYPGLPIGEHIAHALDGADIYNVSDKQFAELLSEYLLTLELDDEYSHSMGENDNYPQDD